MVFRLRKILFNVLMLLVTFNFDKGFELSISLMIEIQSKSIFHDLIILQRSNYDLILLYKTYIPRIPYYI